MSWHDGPFLCVDTETTGVDITTDRIVEIAAVIVDGVGDVTVELSTLLKVDIDIPPAATAVHGITTSRCDTEGSEPSEAISYLTARIVELGLPVVMFNARFDLPLIMRECVRHNVDVHAVPLVLDPFVLDKALDRYRKGSRKLVDVAAHYCVPFDPDSAHGAQADATAAGQIMFELVRRYPQLELHTLTSMFVRQSEFAERQRVSFVDYMRTQRDPQFDDPAGWPLPAITAGVS